MPKRLVETCEAIIHFISPPEMSNSQMVKQLFVSQNLRICLFILQNSEMSSSCFLHVFRFQTLVPEAGYVWR